MMILLLFELLLSWPNILLTTPSMDICSKIHHVIKRCTNLHDVGGDIVHSHLYINHEKENEDIYNFIEAHRWLTIARPRTLKT